MAPFGAGVGRVARSELRRRWRALLGLALLVAFVGAVSLAGFAGARRTASALDRFREATVARDARVVGTDDDTTHELAEELRDEPWVEAVGEFVDFTVSPDGTTILSVYAGTDEGFSNDVDRPLVLDGRMPRADEPDEIAIDEVARDTLDADVGDTLTVNTFDPEDLRCLLLSTCPFQGILGPQLELEVVGVMRDVDAFASTEDPTPGVTASAAFTDAYRDTVGATRSEAAVRLVDEDDVSRLQAFMDDHPDAGTLITPADDYGASAGNAVDVLGTSLVVFALVSGLAGLFAIAQAVTRQVDAAATATPVLPSLGLTRWGWATASALPSIVAIAAGCALAPVGAALASGLFPIGFAEKLEPDPGLRLDLPTLLGGALASAVLVSTWAVIAGRRRCRRGWTTRSWTPTLEWAGLTPAAGARLAFGRWRNGATGPMRSAMVGIAVGTIGAIGATFVLTSLNDLVDDSDRWGFAWDGVGLSGDPSAVGTLVDTIAEEDGVDQTAALIEGFVSSHDEEISAFAFVPADGPIQPTVRRGRLPEDDDEVAIGESDLRALGVDVGESVEIDTTDGDRTVEYEVVGASVQPTFNDPQPSQGAIFTPDGLAPVNQARDQRVILATFDRDADADDVIDRVGANTGVGLLGPITPAQLTNLDEASVVIGALIAFFAALALIGLVQALALSRRRQRLTIAVWRTLGFVPREVRWSVLWQSALATGVAVVVGIPLGLYVGRVAWRLTIDSLGVVDDPTWPTIPAAAALPVAVLAAVLLAFIPAWLSARGEPAEDLRAE
jgi:hypothetical protein